MIPGILSDMGLPMFQFFAMIGAMESGFFRYLNEEEPVDLKTLAQKMNASERGLENLVKALEETRAMADRIDLVERDFEKVDLPDGYDFAFLGNIIHGVSPEGNQELFQKLSRATTSRRF